MQDTATWLSQLHADGVHLNIQQLVYYQAKTALLDLRPRRTIQAKLAGSYLAKTKGRGMEFDEARHYQPGDDIRAIDWRVTARTGKTHTKLYREEKERPIFVLADLSAGMHFGTQLLFKSVQVAHLTALIAWAARARGDRIGGLIFNQHQHREYKPLTRQKAVLSMLHGLLDLHDPAHHADTASDVFTDACARLRRLARPGSLVFLLSDFHYLSDAARQHLGQLSRHCELIAYPVSDPFEHRLPDVPVPTEVAVTDGKVRQRLMLGESNTAETYQQQHRAHFARIQDHLQQCRAQVIPISAAQPLSDQLRVQGRRR
ncbi:DUF58 domain-containing protein [Aestuariibacter halophilus]|uniref:DUF58 domain-containing protein n=1 Tax=Fluctibacter halophilus TaxID=226011 RepID=A0ABS8G7F8_9ALTE|nr:DUF58 domain-containing protein [Aestuariibacter halophilus]MCC2615166.1 DUF58 domain-containing protein [Aestuariibacter halophilus]